MIHLVSSAVTIKCFFVQLRNLEIRWTMMKVDGTIPRYWFMKLSLSSNDPTITFTLDVSTRTSTDIATISRDITTESRRVKSEMRDTSGLMFMGNARLIQGVSLADSEWWIGCHSKVKQGFCSKFRLIWYARFSFEICLCLDVFARSSQDCKGLATRELLSCWGEACVTTERVRKATRTHYAGFAICNMLIISIHSYDMTRMYFLFTCMHLRTQANKDIALVPLSNRFGGERFWIVQICNFWFSKIWMV